MSQLTTSEDILTVLFSVGLLLIFASTLHHSLSIKNSQNKAEERYELILTISDYIRNGEFSENISRSEILVLDENIVKEQIPKFIEKLQRESIDFQLKIKSSKNGVLYSSDSKISKYSQSLSLPIVYEKEDNLTPASMIIRIRD
ncbi:hypothetical protein AKJ66_03635 [candidate division MSBL1 archaeon SCGC-AAA259E22]|uniref:Uncharacterized protein n=1 Tax=candidate division MSBL1 archaeon SCGC-AAA259E22 TaxID=1698265 RepID=A0A133UEU6_9EURY|nr:hypothetical protein AKJ66_03635 [candidate division MSBL1 archaeon SCGC-AAA259E22]